MAIRLYKPTSPARRFMSVLTYEEITKKSPEKSLVEYLKKNAGRNKQGKITVRHQGGGNKIKYRIIDFKRNKLEVPAKVAAIEYDPNRSAFIALLSPCCRLISPSVSSASSRSFRQRSSSSLSSVTP